MYRHKKTREQKVIADLRRGQFIYTLTNKSKSLPATTSEQGTPISSHPSIRYDILKTSLLTLVIIGFQIILFLLLKNHILKIPGLIY